MSRNIRIGAGCGADPLPLNKSDDMFRPGARDTVAKPLAPVFLGNIVMVEAVYFLAAP